MNSTHLYEQIKRRLKEKSITAKKMLTDLGLNHNLMTDMKQRGSKPSYDSVIAIADYLGVTIYDLLEIIPSSTVGLSDAEKSFLEEYRKLDDRGRRAVEGAILLELSRVEMSQNSVFSEGRAANVVHSDQGRITSTLKNKKSTSKPKAQGKQKAE